MQTAHKVQELLHQAAERSAPARTDAAPPTCPVCGQLPFNEALCTAAHMGRVITWDEMLNSTFQFCPKIDELTFESEPPPKADAQGRYPVPVPGEWNEV